MIIMNSHPPTLKLYNRFNVSFSASALLKSVLILLYVPAQLATQILFFANIDNTTHDGSSYLFHLPRP